MSRRDAEGWDQQLLDAERVEKAPTPDVIMYPDRRVVVLRNCSDIATEVASHKEAWAKRAEELRVKIATDERNKMSPINNLLDVLHKEIEESRDKIARSEYRAVTLNLREEDMLMIYRALQAMSAIRGLVKP